MQMFFRLMVCAALWCFAPLGIAWAQTKPAAPASGTQAIAGPRIDFDDVQLDLGTIGPKDKKSMVFTFENIGSSPLLITKATASCGCTVAKYPKQPIPPGGKGQIEAVYRANKSNLGYQHKTITVETNDGRGPYFLNFQILVEVPE